MTIFRNIIDSKLYTIEHLVYDFKFLSHNDRVGIYATPYNWKGNQIVHLSKDHDNCYQFVEDNFNYISTT